MIPPHIVALDDDPSIREAIGDYLADNDLRVTTLASGRELAERRDPQAPQGLDQALDLRPAPQQRDRLSSQTRGAVDQRSVSAGSVSARATWATTKILRTRCARVPPAWSDAQRRARG